MKTVEFTGGLRRVGRTKDATFSIEIAIKEGDRANEKRWLQLSTVQMQSWSRVRAAIFAETNLFFQLEVPKKMTPQEVWEHEFNIMQEQMVWEEAPPEASETGLLYHRCMEFISTLRVAETAEEFEAGGWRYETPGGLTVFRSRDLFHHLQSTGKMPPAREVWAVLEPRGFGSGVQKIGKRAFRVWWLVTDSVTEWIAETEGNELVVNGTASTKEDGNGLHGYTGIFSH